LLEGVLNEYPKVICVNDGSSDGSGKAIRKTKATLIEHPINLGQGAALQTGIEFALRDKNTTHFVTFDADGQHSLRDVKSMLETIKEDKVDIVLGSRFKGKSENMSFAKKNVIKGSS
jgi:glycosyltransferase involved in cell wall biosynthesis